MKSVLFCVLLLTIAFFNPNYAEAATVHIEIKNRAFSPQSVTIAPGDTVTWTNKDSMVHTATSNSQSGAEVWDSGILQQGQSYSKKFTVPGNYSYTCLPHPDMLGTIQVAAPSPTSTPIPPTATKVPTLNPTATIEPTMITQTIAPTMQLSPSTESTTTLSLTVFLNGIGKSGDSLNKGSAGNLNPNRIARPIILSLYTLDNALIKQSEAMLMYSPETGNFTGIATIEGLSATTYNLTFKTDGFLEQKLTEQTINPGQATTIPAAYLVTGDINNDNKLNALDYNMLVNCFEAKATSPSCTNALTADVNDDGRVGGVDYNLFLRELSLSSSRGNL